MVPLLDGAAITVIALAMRLWTIGGELLIAAISAPFERRSLEAEDEIGPPVRTDDRSVRRNRSAPRVDLDNNDASAYSTFLLPCIDSHHARSIRHSQLHAQMSRACGMTKVSRRTLLSVALAS